MGLLVLNTGSSSLKCDIFELRGQPASILRGGVTELGEGAQIAWSCDDKRVHRQVAARDHAEATRRVLALCTDVVGDLPLVAVGNRIGHGMHFAAIDVCRECPRGTRSVAVFDTAYSQGLPDLAREYTPFDMAVLDDFGFRIAMDGADRGPQVGVRAAYLKQLVRHKRIEHRSYIRRTGQDLPEVREWRWSA